MYWVWCLCCLRSGTHFFKSGHINKSIRCETALTITIIIFVCDPQLFPARNPNGRSTDLNRRDWARRRTSGQRRDRVRPTHTTAAGTSHFTMRWMHLNWSNIDKPLIRLCVCLCRFCNRLCPPRCLRCWSSRCATMATKSPRHSSNKRPSSSPSPSTIWATSWNKVTAGTVVPFCWMARGSYYAARKFVRVERSSKQIGVFLTWSVCSSMKKKQLTNISYNI